VTERPRTTEPGQVGSSPGGFGGPFAIVDEESLPDFHFWNGMASGAAIRLLQSIVLAGATVGFIGVGLQFANLNPVGGGCTPATPTTPEVCTAPHAAAGLIAGIVIALVGLMVTLVAARALRSEGWILFWQIA
jgi:hypothetical protein